MKETKKDNVEQSVEDVLASLSIMLKKRQKKLEEGEEKLRKAKQDFEAERYAVYGDAHPSDVLYLNVGGTKMTVLRRTLTSVPGSMLASRFSGRWDESIEKDKDGNYFIDQDYALFEPMINYLRNKSNGTEVYPMSSPTINTEGKKIQDFYRMVEYYGMTQGLFPSKLTLLHGSESDIEITGPLEACANDWATFQVSLCGHVRKIRDFEVTLGSVQRVQIGWIHGEIDFRKGTNVGVGEPKHSLGIDLSKSCYLIDGVSTAIDGLELKEGCVIRSENFGRKWFVDGVLVASVDAESSSNAVKIAENKWKGPHQYGSSAHGPTDDVSPAISVKGSFVISAIEYAK